MSSETVDLLVRGVLVTLALTAVSAVLSLVVGIIIGVLRVGPSALLRDLAGDYVEFFRNIPLLTVLFFIYFGLPQAGLRFSAFTSAVWGIGLYTAAYVGETIRAGIQSIGKGQLEAARALGLSYGQMLRFIVLPQALRMTIPPLGTLLIALLKNTSLASAIVVQEMMYSGSVIEGRTFDPNIFIIIGLIYVVINIPLGLLVGVVERRLAITR